MKILLRPMGRQDAALLRWRSRSTTDRPKAHMWVRRIKIRELLSTLSTSLRRRQSTILYTSSFRSSGSYLPKAEALRA